MRGGLTLPGGENLSSVRTSRSVQIALEMTEHLISSEIALKFNDSLKMDRFLTESDLQNSPDRWALRVRLAAVGVEQSWEPQSLP